MKKLLAFGALVSALAPFAPLPSAYAKIGSCSEPILLGTTISETGPFSGPTGGWRQMTDIFFEELNKTGGVFVKACNAKVPVKIVTYDDQSNPSTAVSLFEKMASVDNVDFFVGPDWTSMGLAVPTVAERHKIPMVMANVATPAAYQRGLKYIWGTPYPTVTLWSERYFEMLKSVDPKPKTIFFVTHDNPVMKGITDFWAPKAEADGLKIVGREVFPSDTKDFSSIILKIRAAKPDIIYISSFDFVSGPLLQQMRQQRVRALDVHHIMLSGALARQVGSDLEGVTGELAWWPYLKGEYSDFVITVLERSKVNMFENIYTMGRLTAYLVMMQAIERAGEIDREKVRDVLTNGEFKAPPGPVIFDATGFPKSNGAYTIQMQNGKVNVVWPSSAGKVIWPSPSWQQ